MHPDKQKLQTGNEEEKMTGPGCEKSCPADWRIDGRTDHTDWLTVFFLLIPAIFDRPDEVDQMKTQMVRIERLAHANFHVSKTSFITNEWKEIASEIEKAEL